MLNIKDVEGKINLSLLNNKNFKVNEVLLELVNYLCIHIKNQINAGADVVQIFDSWAGLVPNNDIEKFCYIPNAKIVEFCKKEKIPNICFPKGIKDKYKEFNEFVKPDGINIDSEIDPKWAKEKLKNVVLQGGLDPKILLKTEHEIIEAATKYIQTFKDIPYVFNLGHGILPQTDPVKVETLIKFYRNFNG